MLPCFSLTLHSPPFFNVPSYQQKESILDVAHHQEECEGPLLSDRGRITQPDSPITFGCWGMGLESFSSPPGPGMWIITALPARAMRQQGEAVFAGHCQSLISSSLAWIVKQCRNSPNTQLNLCKANHIVHSNWESVFCRHFTYSAFFIWSPVCPAMNEALVILVLDGCVLKRCSFLLLWCVAHC